MTKYAIDEVSYLFNKLKSSSKNNEPIIRYVCALFSELAYYNVNEREIDNERRVRVVPCEAYQKIRLEGKPSNVLSFLQQSQFEQSFVVEDREIVIVGLVYDKKLFISFRGTNTLFDWRINLRTKLLKFKSSLYFNDHFFLDATSWGVHRGYTEEALRVSYMIRNEIQSLNLKDVEHIYFTGHSLGGAVAAISAMFMKNEYIFGKMGNRNVPISVYVYGAPRYCDVFAFMAIRNGPPYQIRRIGDMVPTLPPRWFGYSDFPLEYNTTGQPYIGSLNKFSFLREIFRWLKFLMKPVKSHNMEDYRKEIGRAAKIKNAELDLIPFDKLFN